MAGGTLPPAMPRLTRRRLLATPIGLAAAAPPPAPPGLHRLAAKKSRFYGCAVSTKGLADDPALMARVAAEAGLVVSEYGFKWAALHPAADAYDWSGADALMAFAARHKQRVRGHTLVWHESNPDWLEPTLATPDAAERILRAHIAAVAGRYRGRMAHWDVVNEVLRPEDGQAFDLRQSLWFRALGPRYIDIAFDACRQADPKALRVLNEFGLDYAIPWQQRRRDSLLALLRDLVSRNVPVQAVGMQAHLIGGQTGFDPAVMVRFLDDIAALGLRVIVTELDVRDENLPADIGLRDAAVADQTAAYLGAVLPHKAVLGLLTWGLCDKGTWLNTLFPRSDGLPQRPLPLDDALTRKPMWRAIEAALDRLPTRI